VIKEQSKKIASYQSRHFLSKLKSFQSQKSRIVRNIGYDCNPHSKLRKKPLKKVFVSLEAIESRVNIFTRAASFIAQ